MKTSVYIPTIPSHFQYLEDIIIAYLNGREEPDEIIIGPAIADPKDQHMVCALDHIFSRYDTVKIFPWSGRLEAGPNRMRAKFLCEGDIILYHDSDDRVHPERVYWIKKLFTEYPDIWVINHSYVNMHTDIPRTLEPPETLILSDTLRKIYFPNNKYSDGKAFHCYGELLPFPVHAGAVCIRKEVLNHVYWKKMDQQVIAPKQPKEVYRGAYSEDMEFCLDCLWKLNRSMIVNLELYYYRS